MKKRLSIITTLVLLIVTSIVALSSCGKNPKDYADFQVAVVVNNQRIGTINKETTKGLKEHKISAKRNNVSVEYYGYKLVDILKNIANGKKEYLDSINNTNSNLFVTPNQMNLSNLEKPATELFFVYGYKGKTTSVLPAAENVLLVDAKGVIYSSGFNNIYLNSLMETTSKDVIIVQKKTSTEYYNPLSVHVSYDRISAAIANSKLLLTSTEVNGVKINNSIKMSNFLDEFLAFPILLKTQNGPETNFANIITSASVRIIKIENGEVVEDVIEISSANVLRDYLVSVQLDTTKGTYTMSIYDTSKLKSEMLLAGDIVSIRIEEK